MRETTTRRGQVPCAKKNAVAVHTSIDAAISDTLKTVLFAFGIIYLFWPSGDAYFFITSTEALFYSYHVLEAYTPPVGPCFRRYFISCGYGCG